jgi:hypothetical protein
MSGCQQSDKPYHNSDEISTHFSTKGNAGEAGRFVLVVAAYHMLLKRYDARTHCFFKFPHPVK